MPHGRNVLNALLSSRWAITEEKLSLILEIAQRQHDWQALSQDVGRPLSEESSVTVRNGVATVPLVGPMFRYANLFTRISGATSTEFFIRDVLEAVTSPQVRAVIIAVNSPGGEVDGTQEAAQIIYSARGTKPIIAHVDGDGASGAYWMASATDRIVTGRTSLLGSIGVQAVFLDTTEADRKAGFREIRIVSSQSPNKNRDPASDEGRSDIQVILDDLCEVMVGDIGRNRGVDRSTVLTSFGAGGVFVGEKAVAQGLADAAATYEELHAQLEEQVSGRRMVMVAGNSSTQEPEVIVSNVMAALTAGDPPAESETPKPAAPTPEPAAPPASDPGPAPAPAAHPAPAEPAAPAAASELEQARTTAAAAERERLTAIDRLMRPGAEAIIAAAKADPACTPEMTALRILEAEGAGRRNMLASMIADVRHDPGPAAAATPEVEGGSRVRSLMSTLQRVNSERAAARRTP